MDRRLEHHCSRFEQRWSRRPAPETPRKASAAVRLHKQAGSVNLPDLADRLGRAKSGGPRCGRCVPFQRIEAPTTTGGHRPSMPIQLARHSSGRRSQQLASNQPKCSPPAQLRPSSGSRAAKFRPTVSDLLRGEKFADKPPIRLPTATALMRAPACCCSTSEMHVCNESLCCRSASRAGSGMKASPSR